MKITESTQNVPSASIAASTAARTAKSNESTAAAASATTTANTTSDSVRISPQLQALTGQLSTSGAFDSKKVAEIKAAIASGQFQVNAEKVADGLMDTVRDLIQTRKG